MANTLCPLLYRHSANALDGIPVLCLMKILLTLEKKLASLNRSVPGSLTHRCTSVDDGNAWGKRKKKKSSSLSSLPAASSLQSSSSAQHYSSSSCTVAAFRSFSRIHNSLNLGCTAAARTKSESSRTSENLFLTAALRELESGVQYCICERDRWYRKSEWRVGCSTPIYMYCSPCKMSSAFATPYIVWKSTKGRRIARSETKTIRIACSIRRMKTSSSRCSLGSVSLSNVASSLPFETSSRNFTALYRVPSHLVWDRKLSS